MSYIGIDRNGNKLRVGDICIFKLRDLEYEGIIIYDEENFSYSFKMEGDKFPLVLACNKNHKNIEIITNVYETKSRDK